MEERHEAIDWENLVNFDLPQDLDLFFDAPDVGGAGVESWMGELDEILMKDDVILDGVANTSSTNDVDIRVSDLLVDFGQPASSPSVGNENGSTNLESDGKENNKSDDDDKDKKRKRQLRNRDAAMRSRERKKIYVKSLEQKSRYLEEECRELKRQLDFCYYVNQDLYRRLLSGSAYAASMTKPESAVLLLESLLLGSLVWFMVTICLLLQPRLALPSQVVTIRVSVDLKEQESAAPKGTKTSEYWIALPFTRGKRYKASRTKMKLRLER